MLTDALRRRRQRLLADGAVESRRAALYRAGSVAQGRPLPGQWLCAGSVLSVAQGRPLSGQWLCAGSVAQWLCGARPTAFWSVALCWLCGSVALWRKADRFLVSGSVLALWLCGARPTASWSVALCWLCGSVAQGRPLPGQWLCAGSVAQDRPLSGQWLCAAGSLKTSQ